MKFIRDFLRKLFAGPAWLQAPPRAYQRPKDCDGNPVGCTMKCPHCATWTHDYNRLERDRSSYTDTADSKALKAILMCGKCLNASEWFTGAPMPIPYSDVRKVENA